MIELLLYFTLCLTVLMMLAAALSGLFMKRFEETMALSVFATVLVLFIFGLFGKLKAGAVTFVIIAVALFLFVLINSAVRRQLRLFAKNIFTPGFVIFLALMVLVFYMSAGRLISQYDEFTHWALTIKNYMIFDGYANIAGSTTHGVGYAPGLSVFSYFFTVFKGTTDESLMIMGSNVYLISLLLPLLKKIRWKDILLGILLAGFFVVLPWLFDPSIKSFNTLLADCPMGLTFAWVIFTYYSGEQSAFTYFSLILGSSTLTIIKPGSEVYALMVFVGILADVIFFRRADFAKLWKKGKARIAVILYPLATAGTYLTWKLFTQINEMKQVLDYVEVTEEKSQSADSVSDVFIRALTEPRTDVAVHVSYVACFLIFVLLGVLLILLSRGKKERIRTGMYTFVVLFGYTLYAGVLLFMYIYLFSDYEGSNLASMDRYMFTYILGALVFFLYMLITKLLDLGGRRKKLLALVPVIGVFVLAPWTKINKDMINCSKAIQKTITKREAYAGVEEIPKRLDYKKDRVYFIVQESHGYEYQVSYYLATPVPLSYDFEMGWSLGKPYDEGDIWTLNFTVSEWEEILHEGGYTYVYIYHADDQFIDLYGSLFENENEIEDRTCFEITERNGKTVLVKAF